MGFYNSHKRMGSMKTFEKLIKSSSRRAISTFELQDNLLALTASPLFLIIRSRKYTLLYTLS